ncbi:hypothetical protein [uncultured Sphingomonas sp.]|uniref:hypothetical protein n=1 Tax=uncultured Sphingomonas sp. TaxID=158754 RepID=UPI0035CAC247
MKTILLPVAVAVAFALTGCQQPAPEVVDTNPDPMANQLAAAPPVALPPAIKAEKTLRCKDNSLAYVTFFQGDAQAFVRTEEGGAPTTLRAPAAGQPLVAEGGWSLTGGPDTVTLAQPGKPAQSCRG